MILRPDSIEYLQKELPTSEGVTGFDLSAINQLIEHVPEDMTATVQAGMTLGDFQAELTKQNQWLPMDPPCPDVLSIGALLGGNASGPRRFGFGTVRDWLIGMTVVLPDGPLVRNGGKVVKNVAGFDLCKLFVGSRGTLGVIVEATFKLLPVPEKEIFRQRKCASLDEADELMAKIWESETQPHVLDLHCIGGQPVTLVVGFAGDTADVDAQVQVAARLGIETEANLDYDGSIRSQPLATVSVPPAKVIERLRCLDNFVAHAGNGIIYHPGEQTPHESTALEQRIKDAFDPKGILPAS